MPRKNARSSQSQSSSSRNHRSQSNDGFSSSQSKESDLEEQINNCVRYLVSNAGLNAYFRRADILKHSGVKSSQAFQEIMSKATNILLKVYGYNVLVCDQGTNKGYVISNALPFKNYSTSQDEAEPNDPQKILLLLILTHIFMSNQQVSEASLYMFLKSFDVDPEVRHPLFGGVKDYITNTLIKQKYLHSESDPITRKGNFTWGIRAEKEISKHEILKFVCKICKDRQPKSWSKQYDNANKQDFRNEQLNEANNMDLDD